MQANEDKEWLLAELQDLFIVDERYKKSTLSIACGIFRNKKVRWKKFHYTPDDTNADCLADKPNALTKGELKELVEFWVSEEHQGVFSYHNVKE